MGLSSWWWAVSVGEPSGGMLLFALLLLSLTWLLGYVASWFVFRRGNGWVVLFLGVSVLLINLSQLPENNYWFFLLFLFVILGLVIYLSWLKRQQSLRDWGTDKSGKGGIAVLPPAILVGLVLVLAWHVPKVIGADFNGIINQSAPHFREGSRELWERLFAGVHPKSFLFIGKDTLRFWGTPSLGETVLFVINADEPYFWREKSFDTYTSRGWGNSSVSERDLFTQGKGTAAGSAMKAEVFHKVKTKVRTDIVLTAGEPLQVSIPTLARFVPPMTYNIDLSQPVSASSLPSDLVSALEGVQSSDRRAINEEVLRDVLPPDIEVLSTNKRGDLVTGLKVERNQGDTEDIVALRNKKFFRVEQDYTVLSSVTNAIPVYLRSASEEYPPWVSERYLQLPPGIPARIRSLAREVVADEANSYDRARAIKNYLHQIPYAASVSPPPRWRDAVDYFLFSSRIGYCEYYASAMTMMLRSLGIPSRLVIGFTPGDWNTEKHLFIVRERNYHAWTEVYFPDYGWIAFDPTPPGANYNAIAGANIFDAPRASAEEVIWGPASDSDLDDDLDDELDDDGVSILGVDGTSGDWRQGLLILGLAMGLLASILSARVGYRFWRRMADLDYPRQVYAQMCWLASWSGLGVQVRLTPTEYSSRLSAALPPQAEAIGRISELYVAARYGGKQQVSQDERQEVDRLWRGLRRSLVRHALFRRTKVLHHQ
jgi:transglutaminase-like putative cysteine protease